MRGLGVGTWLVLSVLAFATVVDAGTCRIQNGPQTVEYPCGDTARAPSKTESVPWYADQQIQGIIAIVGLLGSAGAGGYAILRMRRRRAALTTALTTLERAYQEAKANPTEGAHRVAAIHQTIQADHQKGRLDDGQFLDLDKRAKDYLVRLRLLDIDVRFRNLPSAFLAELRHLVGDGVVSHAEADLIEHHAAAYAVAEPARSEIVRLARRWASEDDPQAARSVNVPVEGPPAPSASIAARPPPRILTK